MGEICGSFSFFLIDSFETFLLQICHVPQLAIVTEEGEVVGMAINVYPEWLPGTQEVLSNAPDIIY